MNLFLLSINAGTAAADLCDQHVGKMMIELAQMLYCAHHIINPSSLEEILSIYNASLGTTPLKAYRKTHDNHPMSIWIRYHPYHYNWACQYGIIMGKEWLLRYGKRHNQWLSWVWRTPVPANPLGYQPEQVQKEAVLATAGIPEVFFYFPLCMKYYVQNDHGKFNAESLTETTTKTNPLRCLKITAAAQSG